MVKWNGSMEGLGGFGDGGGGANGGGNPYELIANQPQYSQHVAANPSNSLTRRPMNQALIPTHPRGSFDTSMPWADLAGDDTSLVAHNPDDETIVQDNVEVLEELAQKAKREAQGKRKQIPPFVQKLSRFVSQSGHDKLVLDSC